MVRYPPSHAEETRQKILDASGRQFRTHGFGGVGVDGLSREAGVTTGAFYNHFGSKAGAFAAVVAAGVARLRLGIEQIQKASGQGWLSSFAAFYLGATHRRDVAGGCALPSLSADVSRADNATREAYQEELLKVVALIAENAPGGREAAWPILARLVGGVILARAVKDEDLALEIAGAVLKDARAPAD